MVASLAITDTCPFCIERRTSADAVDTAANDSARTKTADFIGNSSMRSAPGQSKRCIISSLLPEVIDDLRQDAVELVLRLVTDQSFDACQIGHTPRHVLETRFVGLVIGDEPDW